MPFVQRVVTPIYLSRSKKQQQHHQQQQPEKSTAVPLQTSATTAAALHQHQAVLAPCAGGTGESNGVVVAVGKLTPLDDYEFEAVTNLTLSNALRQLASLVLIANDIFTELNAELHNVGERARGIKGRIDRLGATVEQFDPKLVAVPESDLATFVQIKNHFQTNRLVDTSLFTPSSRSENLRELYDAAAKTPVGAIAEMDRILGEKDRRSSDIFVCTPVLGMTRRRMKSNIDVEIETRMPAAVEELRKWTSSEAIGDITVTPDCMNRVGYKNNNSLHNNSTTVNASQSMGAISSSGGEDEPDDITTVISRIVEVSNDMPLDHRLPSPEEQCQIIALKFPAELIKVDTSGRGFERMCVARKSMVAVSLSIGEHNNLNDEIQTVKRRSRSRKPRNKRRNTIAGTDQKEIEEAVKGDDNDIDASPLSNGDNNDTTMAGTAASGSGTTSTTSTTTTVVPRSKSNDVLKKDSSNDAIKSLTRMSHFNTLKQWGRNRLRLMHRNSDSSDVTVTSRVDHKLDDVNVYETVISKNKRKFAEKERKLSHERKPSYSSSEKSLTITSQSSPHRTLAIASVNPVKLRESSAIRRQRRSGLGHKDEMNSSSGNWSASSESGRTSIGSEFTAQPKSSASSTSLNHSHPPGSGPPSSIISRRRFLNTSASSSVTSEGTVTPDIQIADPYDEETSSAYSCDTEGYYTSFHVDSGLKTLKEEEPVTPLHTSSALSSTNSFGSSSNKTVLSAENEYELFGKGSTSTTASSAGTVCTTLMAAGDDSERSLANGPAVPERKSSLTKLHRSNSTTSNCTLERSCSSSTVGSTLERTGTIKRNGVLLKKESAVTTVKQTPQSSPPAPVSRTESPDSGNNTSSSPIETNSCSSPIHSVPCNSEFEYSECSDLEGVERVERIRMKTTINSSRIPSLCVITPSNSDDDDDVDEALLRVQQRQRHASPAAAQLIETDLDRLQFNTASEPPVNGQVQIMTINKETGYATLHTFTDEQPKATKPVELKKENNVQHFKKATLLPLNTMFGRLRGVLPNLKKPSPVVPTTTIEDPIYDNAGEYVTIADVKNNNQKKIHNGGSGVYYSNDVVKRNLATVLSGNLNEETEYVSLNELPSNIRCESNLLLAGSNRVAGSTTTATTHQPRAGEKINSNATTVGGGGSSATSVNDDPMMANRDVEGQMIAKSGGGGVRVTLDAHGKVVYNSDSLKRRKGAHTTFVPGPCVKDSNAIYNNKTNNNNNNNNNNAKAACVSAASPIVGGVSNRKPVIVRPVISQSLHKPIPHLNTFASSSDSKIVVSATQPSSSSSSLTSTVEQIPPAATTMLYSGFVPSPSTLGNGNISNQSKQDYQHLSRNHVDSGEPPPMSGRDFQRTAGNYISSTLPRLASHKPLGGVGSVDDHHQCQYQSPGAAAAATPSPFQRNNNAYWTLQTRKQSGNNNNNVIPKSTTVQDDFLVNPHKKSVEDLYSTPNKLLKNRCPEQLRTTGFATYFSSPIARTADSTHLKISPIDPRNTGGPFKTSTPCKVDSAAVAALSLADDLRHKLSIHEIGGDAIGGGGGCGNSSNVSSPLSSGRSTPRLEPQTGGRTTNDPNNLSQTCSDRLGTPKTTLMDFKKLLLTKAGKSSVVAAKPSAVEQLRLARESAAAKAAAAAFTSNSSLNILDLSGSPKTFANRRMIRQGNFGSPSKSLGQSVGKHMSPRSAWKFNKYRTDVMSTAIPEANSEEDTSPNNSKDRRHTVESPQRAVAEKLPTESVVVEESLSMRDNIFMQAEENNFTRGDVIVGVGGGPTNSMSKSLSRAQLSQARSQFLAGNGAATLFAHSTTQLQPQQQHLQPLLRSAQFKNGHYTGISPTRYIATAADPVPKFISLTEAIVDTSAEGTQAPSLETAL